MAKIIVRGNINAQRDRTRENVFTLNLNDNFNFTNSSKVATPPS